VQAVIAVAVLAMFMAAFFAMIKGLRFFGPPDGSTSRLEPR
jgi:hypothetical protein